MDVPALHPVDGDGDDGDVELMRDVVQGSETALARLYDRHAAAIYRHALSVSRDRGMAEEVVQETFLALWDRAELFDPARGSLGAWLSTIARNRAIDRLRSKSRRHGAASFSDLTADQPDPESTVDWLVASGQLVGAGTPEVDPEVAVTASEADAAVASALTGLTELELEPILLAYRDGLTQAEIAARLGWPIGTVKTRSRRALRHLRDALVATPSWAVTALADGSPHQAVVRSATSQPCGAPC
jgi:RNA polymerase sigma-70 factor (ECF subfamily)